jgi:hypothetical protein
MTTKMYSIRDMVAEKYTTPFTAGTKKEALRMYGKMLGNNVKNVMETWDYQLCFIGTFNEATGEIRKPTMDEEEKEAIEQEEEREAIKKWAPHLEEINDEAIKKWEENTKKIVERYKKILEEK